MDRDAVWQHMKMVRWQSLVAFVRVWAFVTFGSDRLCGSRKEVLPISACMDDGLFLVHGLSCGCIL